MHAPSPIAHVRSSDAHSPCMLHRPSIDTVYNTLHAKHRILYIARPPCPPSERGADVPRRPSTVLGGSLQIPMEHALKSDLHQTPRRIFALHYSFGFSFRLPEQRTVQKKNSTPESEQRTVQKKNSTPESGTASCSASEASIRSVLISHKLCLCRFF